MYKINNVQVTKSKITESKIITSLLIKKQDYKETTELC